MPAPETANRNQKAVLWPLSSVDAYGRPVVGSPVEVDVFWQYKRSVVWDANGNKVAIAAEAKVDREIAIGSEMWLGELADWYGTGTGSAGVDDEVLIVASYESVPDLKAREFERWVGLKFSRDVVG